MFKQIIAASLGLAFATAVPAQAGETDAQAPNAKDKIVVNGDKPKEHRVCETIVATGTIRPKKVCRTMSEEEYQKSKGQRDLSDLRNAREAQQNAQFGGHN